MKLINQYKNSGKLGNSYWGPVQTSFEVCRGLRLVTTAGHGGWMVSKGLAHRILKLETIMAGSKFGDYLCFEEDCQWAILEKDLRINYPGLLDGFTKWTGYEGEMMEVIESTLKHYYPQFAA